MPAALPLTVEELDRWNSGQCVCGCGEEIEPPNTYYGPQGSMWASNACKMRAHRRRKKEGRSIDQDTRRHQALRERAKQTREEAAEVRSRIQKLQIQLAKLVSYAEWCEELAAGQTEIPGLPAQSDSR